MKLTKENEILDVLAILTRTTLSMMRRDISATFAALAFSFLRLTIWTKGSATVSQIGKRFAESF